METDKETLEVFKSEPNVKINDQVPKLKIALIIIALTVMLVAGITVILIIVLKDDNNEIKFQYSVMMDAGSSATKVYCYNYKKISNGTLPQVIEKKNFRQKPGIGESTNLDEYFTTIFDSTKKIINDISNNTANLSNVPVFLKGTAGLRKLSTEVQNKIITEIDNVFKEKGTFYFPDNSIKIISGFDEGSFGWIAINYITGILKENDDARYKKKKTIGSLDMGGSSIEIAFIPNNTEILNNKVNLDLGRVDYDIYSNFIEGFGQDDAFSKLMKYIVEYNNYENPCYLKGYSEEYSQDTTKTIKGTGDIDTCEMILKKFMEDILTQYTYFPDPNGVQFIAMNSFAYTASFYGISGTENMSPNDLLAKAKEYCNKEFDEAKAEHLIIDDSYLKVYCFTGLFQYHFLVDVLKFNADTKNILFTTNINGFTPSWAFGAMTYEVGLLPFK